MYNLIHRHNIRKRRYKHMYRSGMLPLHWLCSMYSHAIRSLLGNLVRNLCHTHDIRCSMSVRMNHFGTKHCSHSLVLYKSLNNCRNSLDCYLYSHMYCRKALDSWNCYSSCHRCHCYMSRHHLSAQHMNSHAIRSSSRCCLHMYFHKYAD